MKKLLLFLGATMMVFSVVVGHATASSINVVSVTASSTYSGWDVNNIINGEGLNDDSPPKHVEIASDNAWTSARNDTTGWLIFDLGSTYTLTSTDVWQYGHWNVHPRGVEDFQILSSINGTDYTFVADATLQEVDITPNAAESFSFATTARYIKFDILSNHAGGGNHTGLSEAQFNGSPVPIPAAVWLLGSGLLGLVAIRRRKK